MPQEYKAWDSGALDVPRPTHLYHLPPIGLGTPMVESLTGYIVRLAEAHCVSAGVLYWKEIRALAGKGNIFTFRVSNNEGYTTHRGGRLRESVGNTHREAGSALLDAAHLETGSGPRFVTTSCSIMV